MGGINKIMSMLTSKKRNSLQVTDFAIPKKRAYPIHDIAHARDALSRVSANGTPEEQAMVMRAVAKKYPSLGQGRIKNNVKRYT